MKDIQLHITETQFRGQIMKLCNVYHWKAYFTWLSLHSPSGFPDVNAIRGDRIIYAELKSETGKVTPAQQEWLDVLVATGKCEVYLWKPSQWQEIVEILSKPEPQKRKAEFKTAFADDIWIETE